VLERASRDGGEQARDVGWIAGCRDRQPPRMLGLEVRARRKHPASRDARGEAIEQHGDRGRARLGPYLEQRSEGACESMLVDRHDGLSKRRH
jgi:hypothetical protein